jgi:hypothetical protein
MAYLGLVAGEHSSGDRRRLGAITKAGNTRVRHVLIQAAWHYRRRPAVGATLRRRQQGQDPDVIAHAWKCQNRLYKVFHRLAAKKPKQVAATAVAREMVGFLWAVLKGRRCRPTPAHGGEPSRLITTLPRPHPEGERCEAR